MNSRRRGKTLQDPGLTHLLELDGTIESQNDSGYWTKIEVRPVKANSARPFGLKYNLTLHALGGDRLIGFDNAHSVTSKGESKARPAWDHFHRGLSDDPVPYEYRGADRLWIDFLSEVARVLKEVNDE